MVPANTIQMHPYVEIKDKESAGTFEYKKDEEYKQEEIHLLKKAWVTTVQSPTWATAVQSPKDAQTD